MLNLIQADLFKMYKSSVIKILFIISIFSAVAMAVMAYLITQGQISAKYNGIDFMFSDISMSSILSAVIAGVFICGDFDNKTIDDAISCGSSRGTVIISKAVVFFCAIAFILLPYAVMTGIALSTGSKFDIGSLGIGFLHIITKESGTALSAAVLFKLLVAMLTLMVVYMAQLSICVPLALVLKKPVLVVVITYSISILNGQLMNLRGNSQTFDNIYACTPYGGNYSFVTLSTGTGDLVKTIAVSLVFIIIVLTVTYSIFKKSEIK